MSRFSVETIFSAVDKMTAPVVRMERTTVRAMGSMTRALKNVERRTTAVTSGLFRAGKAATFYGGIAATAVAGGTAAIMREFSKVEDAEAAFTPLLGGAKQAKEAVEALNQTAATTPFQFGVLASSAKQLLPVMEGDIGRMVQTVRTLGDTAGGNAQKLDSITRGFTKAMLKGRVDMESLNMIAEAGVPIFTELAETIGTKTGPRFFKAISQGRVTTEQLTQTFERMTSDGGIFFNGMSIASRTLTGRISTLKDNISLTAASIGTALAPTIKGLVDDAIEIAQQVRAWVDANRDLIRSRVESFVKNFASNLAEVVKWIKLIGTVMVVFVTFTTILKTLVGVMTLVNLVMMANPIGLVIAGVVALSAAFAALIIWFEDIYNWFDGLPGIVKVAMLPITVLLESIKWIRDNWSTISSAANRVGSFLGFGDSGGASAESGVISPQDRVAGALQESISTSTSEVVIRDETGRAEVTGGRAAPGVSLIPSGGF